MIIKPNAFDDFCRTSRDVGRVGRVILALYGHPTPDLDDAEKQFVAMISADAKRMNESQEERREKQREYTKKWRKTAKKEKVGEDVSICENHTPPNQPTNQPTNEPTNQPTTKPNRAGAREVASAEPTFGLGDVSPEAKRQAREDVMTLRKTYVEQFRRAMRSAQNCGNADGPFYDKDVPVEYVCCALTGSDAVGTWKAYAYKLGEDAVREECVTFYHECMAGEAPADLAAAFNARLKRLCDEKEDAQ